MVPMDRAPNYKSDSKLNYEDVNRDKNCSRMWTVYAVLCKLSCGTVIQERNWLDVNGYSDACTVRLCNIVFSGVLLNLAV
jgi:hypothetical protein